MEPCAKGGPGTHFRYSRLRRWSYNAAMATTLLSSSASPVIQAAGGVLYRETLSGDEVMIVHRKRYGDWTLPKGKLKPGESFTEAARREVEERDWVFSSSRRISGRRRLSS